VIASRELDISVIPVNDLGAGQFSNFTAIWKATRHIPSVVDAYDNVRQRASTRHCWSFREVSDFDTLGLYRSVWETVLGKP
jgi:hypothetical protein